MKISVIIPHMNNIPGASESLQRLLASLGCNHEIILVEDVLGYGKAVNQGLREAKGDWLVVANNDTWLMEGKLEHLVYHMAIGVPRIIPAAKDDKPRCFFCMPRVIYEDIKGFMADDFYDERFTPAYWEDDDLIKRLELRNWDSVLEENVWVGHQGGGGMTAKVVGDGEQSNYDINKKRFEEKWNLQEN